MSDRKIIHVDMDAFYASVEQRDDPALRGRPVAVGGSRERGVVAAASYEARAFGVRSAMPSVTARRRCPDLVFVKPRFEVYRAISQHIRAIFRDYADEVEPLSLDEAYLDVTADKAGLGTATAIAREIRRRIAAELDLTASAGVSYNKLLAKLASDHNKPDGLCVITPAKGAAFVAALPVARLHGVGPATAAKMARLGIATGADLAARSLEDLEEAFGKAGGYYHRAARGIDHREVRGSRIRKSLGAESTFFEDVGDEPGLQAKLTPIIAEVWARATRAGTRARTVTLKMKYSDFRIVTRARSFPAVVDQTTFEAAGRALLAGLCPPEKGVRLLGLTLSGLGEKEPVPPASDLFGEGALPPESVDPA